VTAPAPKRTAAAAESKHVAAAVAAESAAATPAATPDESRVQASERVGQTRSTAPTPDDAAALAALQTLPAIGPRLAEKLLLLGVRSPAGLCGRDPEALYDELQAQLGPVDRCVLYAFRCAVYAAEHTTDDRSDRGGEPGGGLGSGHGAPDPELAKWWNWKDGGPALPRR